MARCAVAVRGAALVAAWVVCSLAPAFAADWSEFVDKAERPDEIRSRLASLPHWRFLLRRRVD